MKKILISLAVLAMAACSAGPDTTVTPDDPNVLQFKDTRSSTNGGLLVDHGGKILPTSNTYAIWWGNQTAWAPDVQPSLDSMFQGLTGSGLLNISTQYMHGNTPASAFHTNWKDLGGPPTHAPRTLDIVNEACKMVTANQALPDPTGIYFVYTSNFPVHANFCAWHSHGPCNGVDIQVAYMPNTTGVNGCDPLTVANLGCNNLSEGAQSLANVTSHEFMESITDADISAWYDSTGSEIGDKCAWKFTSCVTLSTGSYQLQEEWSNAANGCVQQ